MKSSYERSALSSTTDHPRPTRAIVSLLESSAKISERLIDAGKCCLGIVILSAVDVPTLNTLTAVISAIPRSVKHVEIYNIEQLLPKEQQNSDGLFSLMLQLAEAMAERDMTGMAMSTLLLSDALGGLRESLGG